MIELKLVPEYDNPTDEERKEIFEYYRRIIVNAHENARGAILDMYGNKVWVETIEEYEARMEKMKNDNR